MDNETKKISVKVTIPGQEKEISEVGGGSAIVAPMKSLSSPLIGGGGLIKMLQQLIPQFFGLAEDKENPFDFVDDNDFDSEDETVKEFKNKGGCGQVIKIVKIKGPESEEKIASLLDTLLSVRLSHRTIALRKVFSDIHSIKKNPNGQTQVRIIESINNLLKDPSTSEEYDILVATKECLLKPDRKALDTASFRIKTAFKNYVPETNIKVAYTTLNTQDGEPYMQCPKSRYQTGRVIAMEVSKCRDYCIDSKIETNGKITCAYKDWLKLADSTNASLGRLEEHKQSNNNLLTLREGERSKPITDQEKGTEERLEDSKLRKDVSDQSTEKRLDEASEAELGHHGEPEKSVSQELNGKEEKPVRSAKTSNEKIDAEKDETLGEQIEESHDTDLDDETIEQMLEDVRVGLTDEEIDTIFNEHLEELREYED